MIEEDFIVFKDFLEERYGLVYMDNLSKTRFFIPLNKNLENYCKLQTIQKVLNEGRFLIGESHFTINFDFINKHIYVNFSNENQRGLCRLYSFRSIGNTEFSDVIKDQWQNIVQIIDKKLETL